MTGFEPQISGVGSDSSANWVTTTVLAMITVPLSNCFWIGFIISRVHPDFHGHFTFWTKFWDRVRVSRTPNLTRFWSTRISTNFGRFCVDQKNFRESRVTWLADAVGTELWDYFSKEERNQDKNFTGITIHPNCMNVSYVYFLRYRLPLVWWIWLKYWITLSCTSKLLTNTKVLGKLLWQSWQCGRFQYQRTRVRIRSLATFMEHRYLL